MKPEPDDTSEGDISEAEVDEALEESFPASDPPSWTIGIDPHTSRERVTTKREDKVGMRADEALAQSSERLIAAETPLGLVTLFHQPGAEQSGEGFHLRFIPCDEHGHLNAAGTVVVGSYEDLDASSRIAASSYGVSLDGWRPISVEELERAAPFSHAPDIEAERSN